MVSDDGLRAAKEKMQAEGVPDAAIATFEHYYEQLVAGESGMLPDADLEQLEDIPEAESLPDEVDTDALDRTVVIKLNGGLGTSMGMEKAKSLLEVKEGHTFLDIIVRQILELRSQHGARLPLVLMDSFSHQRGHARRARAATRTSPPTCPRTSSRTRSRRSASTTCTRSSGRPTRGSSGARRGTATSTRR